jgi:hypothetical protein
VPPSVLPIRGRYLIERVHEAHSRTTNREPQLEERLGARGDGEPVGWAYQGAAPPAVGLDAEGGSDLGFVAVGLDHERQADVLGR